MYRKWFFIVLLLNGILLGSAQVLERDVSNKPGITNVAYEKIKVFPNPADHVVNVIGIKNCEKATITVSDAYGNIVGQYSWAIKNQALNLPVNNLEPGLYSITIRSESQNTSVKFYKR